MIIDIRNIEDLENLKPKNKPPQDCGGHDFIYPYEKTIFSLLA